MKIILRNVTMHRPAPGFAPKIENICGCFIQTGNIDVIEVLPGTLFEVDTATANRLLARFAGEVIEDDPFIEARLCLTR